MLSSIIDAFKVPELRKKILFTLAILALYRLGAYIPVPGIPFNQFATALQNVLTGMEVDEALDQAVEQYNFQADIY